jgi:hypothetical protein
MMLQLPSAMTHHNNINYKNEYFGEHSTVCTLIKRQCTKVY